MRALANDREISGLVGVPVLRVDAWAWVISGVLSGVSGIFLANMVRLQVDSVDLHGHSGGRGRDPRPPDVADGRGHRRSRDRRARGGRVAVSRSLGLSLGHAVCRRRARLALVPAWRLDVEPHGSVSIGGNEPSAAELAVAGAARRHRSGDHRRHRRSISGVGLLAQDIHRGHHHCALQPERRGALCPARHGVALPIRVVWCRRLGGAAPLSRLPHSV